MKATRKNLVNIDFSGNSIYNLSRIIGNEYNSTSISSDPRKEDRNTRRTTDLLITTAGDSEHSKQLLERAAGNLLLRAGVAQQGNGYVHLFAGKIDENEDPKTRGILLDPTSNIYIASDTENVHIGAKKDILEVGEENIILSNKIEGITEELTSANYITLKKNAGTSDTQSIEARTPNLRVWYNKDLLVENTGENTQAIIKVDKLDVESSYKVSTDSTNNQPAYKLAITGANASSVSIKDITSYGTVTGLNLQLSGNFTFNNTYKSDGIGTPNGSTNYDRLFNAYGKSLLEEFRNINIKSLGTSINNTTGEVTGDVFALLANTDVEGTPNYSKLFIQYIEALKDVSIWGNITIGKTDARKKTEVFSSDLDVSSDNTKETHTVYHVDAGNGRLDDDFPYILDVDKIAQLTLDIINTRTCIHANSDAPDTIALDVNNKSTFSNDIILDGTNKGVITSDGTTNRSITEFAHDIFNMYQGNSIDGPTRYIRFNDENGIYEYSNNITLESNEASGSINIKTNGANSFVNIDTPNTTGTLDINSGKIYIYQDDRKDSNFNLTVEDANTSSMKIQDINSTGKILANNVEINGDFDFCPSDDNEKENFVLRGEKYSSDFNYIDEHCPDGNVRILAYNKKPTLDIKLPTYPQGLVKASDSDYSLIQVQNLELSSYAYIRGDIDVHTLDSVYSPTEHASIRTKDLNSATENEERYSGVFNAYYGYTLPVNKKTEALEAFTEYNTDNTKDSARYRLNVTTSNSHLYLDNITATTQVHITNEGANALNVEGASELHNIQLVDDSREISLDTAGKTLTVSADNLILRTKENEYEFIKLEKLNEKATLRGTIFDFDFGTANKQITMVTESTDSQDATEDAPVSLINAYNLTARNHVETTTLKASTSLTTPDATISTHLKSDVETTFKGTVHSDGTLEEFNIGATKGVITFAGDKLQINTNGDYTEVVDTINVTEKAEINSNATFNVECAENLNNTLNMKAANGVIQAAQDEAVDKTITINANKFYVKDATATYIPIKAVSNNTKSDINITAGSTGTLDITSSGNLSISASTVGSTISADTINSETSGIATANISNLNVDTKTDLKNTSTFVSNAKSFDIESGKVSITTSDDASSFVVTGHNNLVINDSYEGKSSYINVDNLNVGTSATIASSHTTGKSTFSDTITLDGSKELNYTISGSTGLKLTHDKESINLVGDLTSIKSTKLDITSGTGVTNSTTRENITASGLYIGNNNNSKIAAYNLVSNTLDSYNGNIKNLKVDTATTISGTSLTSTALSNSITGNITLTTSSSTTGLTITGKNSLSINDHETDNSSKIIATNLEAKSNVTTGTLDVNSTSDFSNNITLSGAVGSSGINGNNELKLSSGKETITLTNNASTSVVSKAISIKGNCSLTEKPSASTTGTLWINQDASESFIVVDSIIASAVSGLSNISSTNGNINNLVVDTTANITGTETTISPATLHIRPTTLDLSSGATVINNSSVTSTNLTSSGLTKAGSLSVGGTATISGVTNVNGNLSLGNASNTITYNAATVNHTSKAINRKLTTFKLYDASSEFTSGTPIINVNTGSSSVNSHIDADINEILFDAQVSQDDTSHIIIKNVNSGSGGFTKCDSYMYAHKMESVNNVTTSMEVKNDIKIKDFTMYWDNASNSLVFARA